MSDLKGWDDLAELEVSQTGNNLLLIDSNNLAYRWINKANYDSFEEEYIRTIESLGRSYSAIRTICCFDFGKSYYRLSMYEEYKANRKKPETEKEALKYEEFFACLNAVIYDLPVEYSKHRGIEADDLIAFYVEYLSGKYEHTWIVSSDKDLYQLVDDNVSIFNMFSRREITIDSILEDYGLTPDEFLVARLMEGDKSDNIPGIEGIGPKRSQSLVREYETIEKLLEALPIKGKAKYIANLNAGKAIIETNIELMDLKKHIEKSIKAGKNGTKVWESLVKSVID